jgi:hypothetical protein
VIQPVSRLSTTALLGLLACGRAAAPDPGVQYDSAGVRITVAPATDYPAPWTATELRRLRAPGPGGEPLLIEWPAYVVADPRGRVYAHDELTERVVVYDSVGIVVGTRGRSGAGPGEYRTPGRLRIAADGSLEVPDFGKMAIVAFDPDGAVLPERSFRHLGYPMHGVAFVGDDAVMADREPRDQAAAQVVRWVTDTGSTLLLEYVYPVDGPATFQCGTTRIMMMGMPPMLAPTLEWAVRDSVVAAAASPDYDVRVFERDRLARIVRRAGPGRPATVEHVRRLHPEGAVRGRADCRVPAAELVAQQGLAETLPEVGGVWFAPDGGLWVQRFTLPDEPGRIDVFSAEGEYRGTLTGLGRPVGFLPPDRVVSAVPDADSGGYHVVVFSLRPAPW